MTNPARSTIDLETNKEGTALEGLSLGNVRAEHLRQEAASLPHVERPSEALSTEGERRVAPAVPNVDTYQTTETPKEGRDIQINPLPTAERDVSLAGASTRTERDAEHELERASLFTTRTATRTIFDRLVGFVARLIKRLEQRILKALKKQPRKIVVVDKAFEKRKATIRAALRQSRYHPMARLRIDDEDDETIPPAEPPQS